MDPWAHITYDCSKTSPPKSVKRLINVTMYCSVLSAAYNVSPPPFLQVGPKELYQQHEELKNLKSGQSKSHDIVKRKTKELDDLERKNRLVERDVARYNNRQNILKDIKHLSYKKHWVVSRWYICRRQERCGHLLASFREQMLFVTPPCCPDEGQPLIHSS